MAKILQSDLAQVGMRIKFLPRNEQDMFRVVALPNSANPHFMIVYHGEPDSSAFTHNVSAFNRDFVCVPEGVRAIPKNLEVFIYQLLSQGSMNELHEMLVELEI